MSAHQGQPPSDNDIGAGQNLLPSTFSSNASNASNLSNASTMKHSTVPISRSTGSAYERPERARTSHACEPCRERKTKCDGERPSCRRCLRTGMSCHYGYGKGWKKRKTAEDLNATSRRLARYESLLTEIMPMVTSNVRIMIEEARQEDANASPGSDTTETDTPRSQSTLHTESSGSSISMGPRVPLSFPLPSPLAAQSSRQPTLRPFESIGSTSSTGPPLRPPSHGDSSEDVSMAAARLPSITASGMLIEPSQLGSQSPSKAHPSTEPGWYGQRERAEFGQPSSPTGRSTYGGWLNIKSDPGRTHADSRRRDYETTVSTRLKSSPLKLKFISDIPMVLY